MGYTVELKKSSRQEAPNSVKEKAISPRGNRSLKYPEKLKQENTIGQLHSEHYHEFSRKADGKPVIQMKPSWNHETLSQGGTKKGDELVKHMSNLPGYLQQIEREENVQEKALNFGVLDWQRLERWKYNEKQIPAKFNKTDSSSSNNSSYMAGGTSFISSATRRKSTGGQGKHLPSHGWRPNSAFVDGQDVPSQRNVRKPQTFETAPWNTISGKQNLRTNDKSSGLKYSKIPLDRGKRKELNYNTTPEKVSSLSSCGEHELPITSGETMGVQNGETNTITEKEFDLAPKVCSSENIVLLLPKSSSRKSFSENIHISKSIVPFNGNLADAIGRRLSGSFYPEELHSTEIYSEVTHSCPLPVSVSTKVKPDKVQKNLVKCEGPEQFDESYNHEKPKDITPASEGKPLKVISSDIEPSTVTESSRSSDQDPAERHAAKGRHPSPRRRFSFSSLGKMTKSFSLKEGLVEPQLNSSYTTIKSGPIGPLVSADSDKCGHDSPSAGSRSRSSPLRRLLDPLLKPRGVHSTESVKLSKINSDSVTIKTIDTNELLQNQKSDMPSVQALLQLTLKNGLPLFKLVVDNSSDILAAAVKKLPTPEEDVPSLIYALYSVHEIKKKTGNWISQGSKGKSSSLGYNVIGQMTVSSSHPSVRESILYGVDIGQDDKETPKFTPSKELAALVINNARNTSIDEEESTNSDDYFVGSNSDGLDIEDYNSTTVILPGGIHGLPKEGAPSSIMNRWRSGGSCDCGGWDAGCKLQILTDQGQDGENMIPSPLCSALEGLSLYVEGGHPEKKPIFCVAPFTGGVYSVDFDPSISLLQAFFIAVAFLSSQRLSNLFEVKLEINKLPEPMHDTVKTPTAVHIEAPARYVTNPPTSPVGRV